MPKVCKHIVIIAGEESGDKYGCSLIKQLKTRYEEIIISGIGGQHMQAAGAELISDLAKHGVTGLTEVIQHLKIIYKSFVAIKKHLKLVQPDLLILVDYPGFNLRLAKYAKKLGLKIFYYISPQIWAWKANRIHTIKHCVDKMAVILPFEKAIYEKAQVPVFFVGHPLVEKISIKHDPAGARKELALAEQSTIIALLPGSRINEIKSHMPVLRDTALMLNKKYPHLHFIIPVAKTIAIDCVQRYFLGLALSLTVVHDKALTCMQAADFVFVASGTASLECALLEKPMCIIYKSSWLTYYLGMKFIKVRFLGLCNLLSDKMIVPEFLQYDCNALELTNFFTNVYEDSTLSQKIINKLSMMKESLSSKKSDCSLIDLIEKELT